MQISLIYTLCMLNEKKKMISSLLEGILEFFFLDLWTDNQYLIKLNLAKKRKFQNIIQCPFDRMSINSIMNAQSLKRFVYFPTCGQATLDKVTNIENF